MQIRRLKIDNYGPVRDADWELESGMTLFFGANESGKTLLVEALIKLLLNGDTTTYESIDRVTGQPAGFLLFDTPEGEVQVPNGDYQDLFADGTEPSDIRNAFVIRDYDLRQPKRKPDFGKSEYLRAVTDRIMGSQTREIEAIQEHIAALGNLANKDSDRLMNRAPEKLKSRRDDAHALIGELSDYRQQCREDGILDSARGKRQYAAELERVVEEIDELERARTREQLEAGRALLDELRKIEQQLEDFEDREDKIATYTELQDEIEPIRGSLVTSKETAETYRKLTYLVTPLSGLAIVGAIASHLLAMPFLAGVLLPLLAVVLGIVLLYVSREYLQARSVVAEGEQIVRKAQGAGIAETDLETIHATIEEEIARHEETARRLSEERLSRLGELKGQFGPDFQTLEEWEDEIDTYAEQVEPVVRAFDEQELASLLERRTELEEKIRSLSQTLEAHGKILSDFDRDMRAIGPWTFLDNVEELTIESVEDLPKAVEVLETYVAEIERKQALARSAIDIFEELVEEEEQALNRVFTEDDFVIRMFRDVTDGNYTDVWYDEDDGIQVRRADGRVCSPDELSQGTYDLLYLTIRIKLAQELAGDRPGFLILDDAFIHSDANRTVKEIEILGELVSEGWQIMYFSFKQSVRDAVESIEYGSIIELSPLDFDTSGAP